MAMDEQEHQALWEAVRATGVNWRPGHNTITALSSDEQRRRLGYVPAGDEPSLEERERSAPQRIAALAVAAAAAPANIDWRNVSSNNYVTPIKDQGNCGSCVSFGTAATIESCAHFIKQMPVNAPNANTLPDLSEAQLFYCGNTTSQDPCAQGWQVAPALSYATNTGLVPATCFPYAPGNQACNLCNNWQMMLTQVAASQPLSVVGDMKNWLLTKGPLITCFTVYSDFWAYTGGVYQHTSGTREGGIA